MIIFKKFFYFLLLLFFVTPVIVNALGADVKDRIYDQESAFTKNSGITTDSIGSMAATVIAAFLSLLGIIFVSLMIYAGYHWMTAGGEEEKINKAKDTIRRAIIGLIIVMSAYAITRFVFTSLPESGSSGSSNVNLNSSN